MLTNQKDIERRGKKNGKADTKYKTQRRKMEIRVREKP